MLRRCEPLLKQIRSHTEVAKLIYKKKSNFVQSVSNARPDVVTALLHAPPSQLADAVVRVTKTRELDRDALIRLLKKFRAFRRLDLAELAANAYCEAGRSLSPHHVTLLMAHANEARQWQTAAKYWHLAVSENKVRPLTHAALLQTMRVAGRWRDAVAHLGIMVADGIPVDSHALHTVMNTARQSAPWTVGISAFSFAVQKGGTRPNELVYLVLLRCIAQSRLPARWHYSLSILSQMLQQQPKTTADNTAEGDSRDTPASPSSSSRVRLEVTAGAFNAAMESAISCGRWRDAIRTFHLMEPNRVHTNQETFRALMSARRNAAAHCVRVLAEAHRHASPITEEMYRMLFRALLLEGGSMHGVDSVIALAQSETQRAVADAGNPNVETRSITLALLDAVLDHADPDGIDKLMSAFESKIETVVPEATRGLGTIGDPTQRWIADGPSLRLAVVDHNALYSKYLESLRAHYDHVLIPISSVRTLQKRTESVLAGTVAASHNRWVLHRLRQELSVPAHQTKGHPAGSLSDFMHLLPLHHELFARRHIQQLAREERLREPELQLLQRSAAESAAAELLLEGTAGNDVMSVRSNSGGDLNAAASREPRRSVASAIVTAQEESVMAPPQSLAEPPFIGDRTWLTTGEKVISVAVMLKKLNPDAEIHVVSPSKQQLRDVERWNAHSKLHHGHMAVTLVPVQLSPTDLMEKAPPPESGVEHHEYADADNSSSDSPIQSLPDNGLPSKSENIWLS